MIDNSRQWARRQLAPMTLGLMGVLVAGSLFFWFSQGRFADSLSFGEDWLHAPWTILTYPFAYSGVGAGGISQLIWFLCLLALMLYTCAGVERQIGTPKYAALWVASSVLPALLYWIGELVVHRGSSISGPLLPVATITFIFCIRNQSMQFNLWGILPLTGKWIAVIIVAGLLFQFGSVAPLLGVFAVLHLGLAYLYANNQIPFLPYAVAGYQNYKPSKQERERQSKYFDEVRKREKDREERERLRKLFEGSLSDEDGR